MVCNSAKTKIWNADLAFTHTSARIKSAPRTPLTRQHRTAIHLVISPFRAVACIPHAQPAALRLSTARPRRHSRSRPAASCFETRPNRPSISARTIPTSPSSRSTIASSSNSSRNRHDPLSASAPGFKAPTSTPSTGTTYPRPSPTAVRKAGATTCHWPVRSSHQLQTSDTQRPTRYTATT